MDLSQVIEGGELSDRFDIKPKAFSAGLNFGGGIEFVRHIQIGINYALGMTDDFKNNKNEIINAFTPQSSTWSVVAAYYF